MSISIFGTGIISKDSTEIKISDGALILPVGNTSSRPATASPGMIRFNSESERFEAYSGNNWLDVSDPPPFDVEYLVVAGGGGSGFSETSDPAGGGGAGGYRSSVSGELSGGGASAESTLSISVSTSYTVTVGAGGAAGTSPNGQFAGGNSVFGTITSLGGGGGGNGSGSNSTKDGRPGGSGGGSGFSFNGGGTGSGGAGTSGQGYAGGTFSNTQGGGGGGAGAAGTASITGGSGINSSITGSPVFRAAGGNGANSSSGASAAGTANTGNGAKAGWNSGGAAGGSGIVILKYPNSLTISNPGGGLTLTTDSANVAGYKITTFTAGTGTIQWS